jgi:N-acetyl-gamma-glutamyl-phosphate reductase
VISAGIVGASGYSGAELFRLLRRRDDVEIRCLVAAASAGRRMDELYPEFNGPGARVLEPLETGTLTGLDVVFIALPSGQAMNIVPALLGTVGRIIDLGGDFRLSSPAAYERYYGRPHTSSHLLPAAVYGLPEINRDVLRNASLVANPGCYPTGAILALYPALVGGIASPEGIAITSLSGVSGAGRSASVEMSFSEVNENARAYRIGNHQHIPEIQSALSRAAGTDVRVSFVPHLVPLTRGIYTTIHATLARPAGTAEILAHYREFYRHAPFVRITERIPELRDVYRTNFCDISITIDPGTGRLIILSVIDNLMKGAAGQAIQNMNLMFGCSEECGLN